MAGQIEVGPRADGDVAPLYALAREAFSGMPGWSDGRVLRNLRQATVFVARDGGRLAGYVAFRQEPPRRVVVEQILVAPGHERRGIGHRLLAHAEGYAIARGARWLRIVAEADNGRARAFYCRAGFVPVAAELLELSLPEGEGRL